MPLVQLQRTSKHLRAWLLFRLSEPSSATTASGEETKPVTVSNLNRKTKRSPKRQNRKDYPQLLWVLAVVSLTSVMGNRFYNQPKLDVGKAAPQTIRAPFDASVEDTKTTEEKRKAARTGFVPVLMLNNSLTQDIYQELQQSLDKAEELRKMSGTFPFVDIAILSESTQGYLRQTKEWEWQAILALVDSGENVNPLKPPRELSNRTEDSLNLFFAQAVNELQLYRQQSSPQAFSKLIESISGTRQAYARVLRQLSDPLAAESGRRYDVSLLNLSDEVWKETRIGITQSAKRILTQGIPPGLPSYIVEQAVRMQVSTLVPLEAEPLAVRLLTGVLKPNLAEDKEQTKLRAEQAAQAVEPEIVSVEQGEVIVKAGEEITQADFVLLDYFHLSRREINWLGLVGFGSLVTGVVGIFWLVERRVHPNLRRRDHLLLLLLSLSTPLLGIFGIRYTDLPAIGLLVGSFYSPALGVTVVGLLTGLVAFSMTVGWEYLLAGAAGGLLSAVMAGRMRSREELAWLGGAVGLTQGSVYLILTLIPSAAVGAVWYTILQEAILYGLAGIAWSVVALGISPYLERLFDLITPIRLAELSNPNRSLLKRLATEAPGTFQHTLFVASLAEAAARELHCNVELVRAGTLYHDIGKMHDPLGFIENQMGGSNKHDEINDPWMSAEIIKKHVSEGLCLARKHNLPKAIRDFIPEHQGTLLISYFYIQAQQRSQQEGGMPIQESDFRYDGPIPQSRETGIVMLADACEAALRSLKDVTPETALSTINKILKARWQDNQLVDSGLTREDLSVIAEVFVRVWQQYHHQRIAYPKAALNSQPSAV
ncbi:MAG: HD family phosphohydrolase [Coleofasciculus sp. S288]|nr:HD family phosphohydrolase [Coleofasciculus sp. S288]